MHVGIAGPRLARDIELLARLTSAHLVTIAPSPRAPSTLAVLHSLDVLVLEAGGDATDLTRTIAHLREQYPRLTLVLVNGGLTQLEIAELFRLGVADYFAAPWNDALLAERIDVLAARHHTSASTAIDTLTGERR